MDIQVAFTVLLLAGMACYLLWVAYQVRYKGRAELIKFGSGPMPGANLLNRQFAALHALHGLACAVTAALIAHDGKFSPAIWLLFSCSIVFGFRRSMLIRAIEIHATSASAKSEA